MSRQTYARYSLTVTILLLSVYILNLLYKKAVQDTDLLPSLQEALGIGFQGLQGPAMYIVLLLMSTFLTATLVLKEQEASS